MSKPLGWNAALAAGVLGILAAPGCRDDTAEAPFHDQEGRQCVRSCTIDACTIRCEAVAAPTGGCTSSMTPCFTAEFLRFDPPAPSFDVLALCDACCSVAISTWLPEDCSPVVCVNDSDCAMTSAGCEGGYCRRGYEPTADLPSGS
jgi:hypothetical protein